MPEPIVSFNEESLRTDLREPVRRTVEDTLNGLLEEADDLVGAERYERTADREACRADHYDRQLTYTGSPRGHRRRMRTNNAVERLNREVRRRTRVVGTFPDGRSALMLVTARLKYVAESEWGSRRYLDMTLLEG